MTQEELDTLYQEWLPQGGLSAAFNGSVLDALKVGAAQFGNFIRERVEVKADDPPKE